MRCESKPWTMNDASGSRSGVTTTVRVLVGDADFVDVKIPTDQAGATTVPFPSKGESVDYGVVPGISGGKVSLSVRGNWSDLIADEAAPVARKRAS